MMLQSMPARLDQAATGKRVAAVSGFSLHAGVAAEAEQRGKLERQPLYQSPGAL